MRTFMLICEQIQKFVEAKLFLVQFLLLLQLCVDPTFCTLSLEYVQIPQGEELTVLRMKSGLKRTLSPQSFIRSGVGSLLDTIEVTDSLLPPFTTATKSSTMRPLTVSSKERVRRVYA